MKLSIIFLLMFYSLQTSAQSLKGRVVDSKSGDPMPFVNITLNNSKIGTATDLDGFYSLPRINDTVKYINLSFVGYKKLRIEYPETNIIIRMEEQTAVLDAVEILASENPAHRIIRNTVENRERHNPSNIDAFSYKTYSKLVITLNTDSIDDVIDTVQVNTIDTSYSRLDSSDHKLLNFMDNQHLFFMESVTERNFLAPSRDNETVLASRTSGFKSPMFSLFSSQMQSFSFYDNYISILGKEYLNPISPGSDSRYLFILEDTTYNSFLDTVFIVSFRPKKNYGFQPMQGLLYINAADWAITNVIARPFEETDMGITIEQHYKKFGDNTWFPVQLNAEMDFASISVNNVNPIGKIRTTLKDIKINPVLNRKDISRAEITINDDAVKDAELILPKYRTDTLSDRENTTYVFNDSLSKAENIEAKMQIINSLARGYIPWGPFDFGLDKTIRYNNYEGLRLGGNMYTNKKVSKWFRIGGYFGYGFEDQRLKYGWDMTMTIHKHSNFKFFGGYFFDISESGAPEFLQRKNYGLSANVYRFIKIEQWDEISRFYAGFTYDLFPKTHLEVKFQRENRYTIGDYLYQIGDTEDELGQNGFNYSELISSLRYAPNEKFIEGASFGKFAYELKYPIFYFQYARGFEGVLESDFSYHKIDALYENQFRTLWLGTISIIMQAGIVDKALPYSKLYTNMSNMTNAEKAIDRYASVADRQSFETMRINEFLSDQYIQILLRQDLKSLLFRRATFAPHIELVTRMAWGGLRNPDLHYNLPTKGLEKGFYESGIEFNNLLSNKIGSINASIGLGAYYRYGPNSLIGFENNFALKLTSKLIF